MKVNEAAVLRCPTGRRLRRLQNDCLRTAPLGFDQVPFWSGPPQSGTTASVLRSAPLCGTTSLAKAKCPSGRPLWDLAKCAKCVGDFVGLCPSSVLAGSEGASSTRPFGPGLIWMHFSPLGRAGSGGARRSSQRQCTSWCCIWPPSEACALGQRPTRTRGPGPKGTSFRKAERNDFVGLWPSLWAGAFGACGTRP